jgi:hypothetical protein
MISFPYRHACWVVALICVLIALALMWPKGG